MRWELLPKGDHGILPPGVTEGPPADPTGDVLEEAHIVPLAYGGYYVMGRTTQVRKTPVISVSCAWLPLLLTHADLTVLTST